MLSGVQCAVIAGGTSNVAGVSRAAVGAGDGNIASGGYAPTVCGGANNKSNGTFATVCGGHLNSAVAGATTVLGGDSNTASGGNSTIVGGYANTAAGYASFAAGQVSQANHDGAFVWADFSRNGIGVPFPFASTGTNEFAARAAGGVRFVSSVDPNTGTPLTGVTLPRGGISWSAGSDRNSKENFAPVDGPTVLAGLAELPILTWNARSQSPSIRHMGPTAQDFQAAFGLGEDDTHISTVDADGIALAAIQELYRRNIAQNEEIRKLAGEVQALKAQLAEQ